MLYPLSYEGLCVHGSKSHCWSSRARTRLQAYKLPGRCPNTARLTFMKGHVSAPATAGSFLPDTRSIRANIGGWAQLSVVQYFVAEAAVIAAWSGPEPYSRTTGFISDLGAVSCGIYEDRAVCSPLHLLMNASFVVQGLALGPRCAVPDGRAVERCCAAWCASPAFSGCCRRFPADTRVDRAVDPGCQPSGSSPVLPGWER